MNGRLTGAAPSSPAERDAFSRAGKQPYSIKIGNRWFQYNQSTGPLALALAATAAFHDSFARTGNAPITERVSEAAGVIGNSIVDSSFFRGIENLMNAISDPKRFGERFAGDLAAGMVPLSGLQRNIANAVDPMVRQPDGMYERILSGLLLLSKKFLPNLTFWGASPCRRSAQEWPHSYQHASPRTNLAAQLMPN